MKVKFLQDFRGVETNEAYYRKGEVVNLDDQMAAHLITEGRAKAVIYGKSNTNRNVQHRRRSNDSK